MSGYSDADERNDNSGRTYPIPAHDGEALERLKHDARLCHAPSASDLRWAVALIATQAERIGELEAGLRPFAEFGSNVDAVGWTSNIHREPISYWFGPSDFRLAALLTKGQPHD